MNVLQGWRGLSVEVISREEWRFTRGDNEGSPGIIGGLASRTGATPAPELGLSCEFSRSATTKDSILTTNTTGGDNRSVFPSAEEQ